MIVDPTNDLILSHLDEFDTKFFDMCNDALQKINIFFSRECYLIKTLTLLEKISEANFKYHDLSEKLETFLEAINNKPSNWLTGSHISLSWKNSSVRRSVFDYVGRERDSSTHSQSSVRWKHLDDQGSGMNNVRPRFILSPRDAKSKKQVKKEPKSFIRIHDLKLAFSEFYLSLALLQNYQTLNYTGFRKILKKHDKLFQRQTGFQWKLENVDPAEFNTSTKVDELISKVEDAYIQKLEHGDRQKAMKRLRVPPLSETHNPYSVFRFGLFAGIFITQSIVIILTCIYLHELPEHYFPALRFFRAVLLLIAFLCLFGVNVYGWRTSGVNHILIFEIDPRTNLDHFQLLEISLFLACCWGFAVIYFLYSEAINSPPYASPFLLVIFIVLILLNPLKFGYHQGRLWLLKIIWRIFRAPFVRVNFADFWLADQMNSLAFIFSEMAFFICFYSSQIDWRNGMLYIPHSKMTNGTATVPDCATDPSLFLGPSCRCSGVLFGLQPVLLVIPAWFRFAQCLRRYRDMTPQRRFTPHILNAGKYASSFLVTVGIVWFDTFDGGRPALTFVVISYLIQSVYTYMWDVLMDWGLMDKNSENRLLREELVYRYHAYYYAAMFEDLVLRLTWTLRVGLHHIGSIEREIMLTVLGFFEVFRRFVWNFFRLENEHLNNCGEFRAVRDISIMPLRKTRLHSASSWSNTPQDRDRLRLALASRPELYPRDIISPSLYHRRINADNESDTVRQNNLSPHGQQPKVVDSRTNKNQNSDRNDKIKYSGEEEQMDHPMGFWDRLKSSARRGLKTLHFRNRLPSHHTLVGDMELVQNPKLIPLKPVVVQWLGCPADVETQPMPAGGLQQHAFDNDTVKEEACEDEHSMRKTRDGPSHSSHSDPTSSLNYSPKPSRTKEPQMHTSHTVLTLVSQGSLEQDWQPEGEEVKESAEQRQQYDKTTDSLVSVLSDVSQLPSPESRPPLGGSTAQTVTYYLPGDEEA